MTNYLPVIFRVYHVIDNGPKKGKPILPGITMTLNRFVGCSMNDQRFESVGHTVDRLKKMLIGSSARYSIMAAKETDDERKAYRAKHGLEVETTTSNYDPINGNESEANVPLVADVDDESRSNEVTEGSEADFPIITPMHMSTRIRNTDIEGEKDDGRIKAKRAHKKPAEARVAA